MLKITARLFAVFLSVAAFFAIASIADTASALDCPAGQHPATADDVQMGIASTAGASCVDSSTEQRLKGGCDYNPYQVLETQYKGGSDVLITPRISSSASLSDGIDPVLACRLTKFFKAANEQGIQVRIISAYRSVAKQLSMCGAVGRSGCATPGRSCHQYGLAVDVSTSKIGWLRAAAPQFQLVFPYYGQHIQCAEHPTASVSSCNRPCNGSIPITPDLSRIPSPDQIPDTYYQAPPGGDPSVRDSAEPQRNPFQTPLSNGTLNQQPAPVAPQPAPAPQTQLCTPQYQCQGSSLVYQNSNCTTQVVQQCPYGCIGNQCSPAPVTLPTSTPIVIPTPTSTPTTTPFGTSTPTSLPSPTSIPLTATTTLTSSSTATSPFSVTSNAIAPSWLDIIMSAAGIEPSKSVSTNVPASTTHLNGDLSDAVGLDGQRPGNTTHNATSGPAGPIALETFVSDDLKTSAPSTPAPDPRLLTIVGQLRLALEKLVTFLSPARPAVYLSQWSPSPSFE